MKNTISSFDLEAAFKALDEIEIPSVGKVLPNRVDLHEHLKRVDKTGLLIEEYYDLASEEEVSEAIDDREAEIAKAKLDRIEKIVDLDAESPDELLSSYAGKLIMQCPQCMTLFYKNEEDIVPSEDDPLTVNVEEACQHCGNTSGYQLVGRVSAVDESEVAPEEPVEEVPEEDTNLDELEEIPEEEGVEEETAAEDLEAIPLDDEEVVEEETEEEVEESFKPTGTPLVEDVVEVTDEQHQEESTKEPEASTEEPVAETEETKTEALTEWKITDIDDIDEDMINEVLSESLTNVYENVSGFELASCTTTADNTLILEGKIKYTSGNERSAKYVITEAKTKGTNVTLYGLNEELNLKFAIRGILQESKFNAAQAAYKYNINEKLVEGYTYRGLLTEADISNKKIVVNSVTLPGKGSNDIKAAKVAMYLGTPYIGLRLYTKNGNIVGPAYTAESLKDFTDVPKDAITLAKNAQSMLKEASSAVAGDPAQRSGSIAYAREYSNIVKIALAASRDSKVGQVEIILTNSANMDPANAKRWCVLATYRNGQLEATRQQGNAKGVETFVNLSNQTTNVLDVIYNEMRNVLKQAGKGAKSITPDADEEDENNAQRQEQEQPKQKPTDDATAADADTTPLGEQKPDEEAAAATEPTTTENQHYTLVWGKGNNAKKETFDGTVEAAVEEAKKKGVKSIKILDNTGNTVRLILNGNIFVPQV